MRATVSAFDGQGRPTTKDYEVVGATIVDATADMGALLTDLAGVSGLGWTGYNLLSKVASAEAGEGETANKDEAVVLRFAMADGSVVSHRIPAPKKTAGVFDFVTGGVVDITNAAVIAYADNFINGDARLKPGVLATALINGYLEK